MKSWRDVPRDPDNNARIETSDKPLEIKSKYIKESTPAVQRTVYLSSRAEQYKQYLKDKSVAIVGRASYLAEHEFGEEIDAHDVVVRIHTWQIHRTPTDYAPEEGDVERALSNRQFVPSRYHPNVGSKTDVLYLRLQWLPHDDLNQFITIYKHDGVAQVGCETFFEMAQAAPQHHYLEQHWGPVHVIPIDFYNDLSARLNYAEPLPGTLVSAYAATSFAKSVTIYGCPCYQDVLGKTEHAKLNILGKHNTLADFHYMRQLVQRDMRYSCDPIMDELFRLEIS